jgi:hypothetical protein
MEDHGRRKSDFDSGIKDLVLACTVWYFGNLVCGVHFKVKYIEKMYAQKYSLSGEMSIDNINTVPDNLRSTLLRAPGQKSELIYDVGRRLIKLKSNKSGLTVTMHPDKSNGWFRFLQHIIQRILEAI